MPKIPKRPSICKPDEGIALIPIGKDAKDGYAIVDIDNASLDRYWWSRDSNGYARTNPVRGGKAIYLHTLVLTPRKGFITDHKNRNILDNRRENLRRTTQHKNSINRSLHKNNSSGYRGVVWNKSVGKWEYRIQSVLVGGWLGGVCDTKEEAARQYNRIAKKYFGDRAVLNDIKEP